MKSSSEPWNHILGYQSRIFESSTNKIRSFRRFKDFRCFQSLVLSYRANSKRQKRWKISSMVEYWFVLLEFLFWDCYLCFLLKRASWVWSYITFWRYFPTFQAFPPNKPDRFNRCENLSAIRKIHSFFVLKIVPFQLLTVLTFVLRYPTSLEKETSC